MQKEQDNAGTLSLRSARSGTKLKALPFVKYRRQPKHLLMYLMLGFKKNALLEATEKEKESVKIEADTFRF